MNKNITYIYSLEDPRNDQIRYIGKADIPENRYKAHLKDNNKSHKVSWIKSLLKQGLQPILNIEDEILKNEFSFWERYYISLYRSWGFDLLNLTEGGEGESGWHHSFETIKILSEKKIGIKYETSICFYCGLKASNSNIKFWHNDRCLKNPAIDKEKELLRREEFGLKIRKRKKLKLSVIFVQKKLI